MEKDLYKWIACHLKDDTSKVVFSNRLMFSLTGDKIIDISARVRDSWDEWQYFDLEELKPSGDEVFVDDGCYDAGSSMRFLSWAGQGFRKIYAYEPESYNYESFWEAPCLILEMKPGYRLYLRHYSLNEWETVLYAIDEGEAVG